MKPAHKNLSASILLALASQSEISPKPLISEICLRLRESQALKAKVEWPHVLSFP